MNLSFASTLFFSLINALHGIFRKEKIEPSKHVYLLRSFSISNEVRNGLNLQIVNFAADQINRDSSTTGSIYIPLGNSVSASDVIEIVVEQHGKDFNLVTMIIINDDVVIDVNQFVALMPIE